jgi:hypothetical protein
VSLDFPVSLGGYQHPRDPGGPILLHLAHVPGAPNSGLAALPRPERRPPESHLVTYRPVLPHGLCREPDRPRQSDTRREYSCPRTTLSATGHAAAPPSTPRNSRPLSRSDCIRCRQPEWQHTALVRFKSASRRSAIFRLGN